MIVNCVSVQETRERVKLLIQLADNLVEKGHAHAAAIKQSVAEVDQRYKCFSSRMDYYKSQIEDDLGIQSDDGQKDLSIDRNSDPLLEEKIKGKDLKELNEEKRRSARRKEYVSFWQSIYVLWYSISKVFCRQEEDKLLLFLFTFSISRQIHYG